MSKSDQNLIYSPSDVGIRNGKLFGLPFEYEDSQVVVLPVPWEVTVSYRTGTALGPQAILEASTQVDLFDPVWPDGWRAGFYMLPIARDWLARNVKLRELAGQCIAKLEQGVPPDDSTLLLHQGEVNAASSELNDWIERQAQAQASILEIGKRVELMSFEQVVIVKALVTQKTEQSTALFSPGAPVRCRIICEQVRVAEFIRRSIRWQL